MELQSFLQDFNIGHWQWNINTNQVTYSDVWCSQLGRKVNEVESSLSTFENLLHPNDKEATMNRVRQFIAHEIDNFSSIFRLQHSDGTFIEIFSTGNFLDKERTVLRGIHIPTNNIYQGFTRNQFYEFSISKIISTAKSGVFVSNLNGNIKYLNSTAVKFFSKDAHSPEDILERNIAEFYPESIIFSTLAKLFIKQKMTREYAVEDKSGVTKFYEIDFTIEKVFNENMVIGIIRDISHKK